MKQQTKCPDCGGPLPKIHGLEENCPYCGALLKFEMSTLPVEKKEEIIKTEGKNTAEPPIQRQWTNPQRSSYTPTNGDSNISKPVQYGVALILFVISVALVIGFINAFNVGDKDPSTNPEHQIIAPTAMIIDVPTTSKWWDENIEVWMSSVESERLRETKNAINYVIFDANEIRYAADVTIQLHEESWENKRPYFVEAVSVIGTCAVVQVQGVQYTFNTYQPMTWKGASNIIFMIDIDGNIWVVNTTYTDVEIVNVNDVEIPIEIKPNKNLEIGYKKN